MCRSCSSSEIAEHFEQFKMQASFHQVSTRHRCTWRLGRAWTTTALASLGLQSRSWMNPRLNASRLGRIRLDDSWALFRPERSGDIQGGSGRRTTRWRRNYRALCGVD